MFLHSTHCIRPPYSSFFLFNAPATTEIYTLSLHDALPIYEETNEVVGYNVFNASRYFSNLTDGKLKMDDKMKEELDRKSTRLNSSHVAISYAVFCLKKKKNTKKKTTTIIKQRNRILVQNT